MSAPFCTKQWVISQRKMLPTHLLPELKEASAAVQEVEQAREVEGAEQVVLVELASGELEVAAVGLASLFMEELIPKPALVKTLKLSIRLQYSLLSLQDLISNTFRINLPPTWQL